MCEVSTERYPPSLHLVIQRLQVKASAHQGNEGDPNFKHTPAMSDIWSSECHMCARLIWSTSWYVLLFENVKHDQNFRSKCMPEPRTRMIELLVEYWSNTFRPRRNGFKGPPPNIKVPVIAGNFSASPEMTSNMTLVEAQQR